VGEEYQKTRLKNATRQKQQDDGNSDKIEQKEIDCWANRCGGKNWMAALEMNRLL